MIEQFGTNEAPQTSDESLAKFQNDAIDKTPTEIPRAVADANLINPIDTPDFSPMKLAQAQTEISQPKNCPRSNDYMKFIRKAVQDYYDPSRLGNIRELSNKYNCQISSPADAVKFADQALDVLDDPHTDIYNKEEVAKINERSNSKFTGIGITYKAHRPITDESDMPKGPITISRVFVGSPAQKAGLQAGDLVTAIDGKSLDDVPFDQAHGTLSDVENGQAVKFDIVRDGTPHSLEVTKGVMDLPSVRTKALEGDITYVAIDSFKPKNLVSELHKAIEANKDSKGFIIDLRDNGGGDLESSIQMASLFVDQGKLMSKIERESRSDEDEPTYNVTDYHLNDKNIDATTYDSNFPGLQKFGAKDLERLPDLVNQDVVILVNGSSASASEVFSGALRDNGDAILLGSTTYGKGIGQTIYTDLPDGANMALTTFRYETPSGVWPGDGHKNKIGLKPDIVVPMAWEALRETDTDVQLRAAHQYLLSKQK